MNIWLVTIGEPLPVDGNNIRLYRTGLISNLLIKKGHQVTWWSSSFNHIKKKQRSIKTTSIKINNLFKIILLRSISYRKNISISRILNHINLSLKFYYYAEKENLPDIILCSYPTIELSLMAIKFGRKYNIPVIIDIRDLWPDIFIDIVPLFFKYTMKLFLSLTKSQIEKIFKYATAITGLTDDFLEWGLKYAERKKTSFDHTFPMAYDDNEPEQKEIKRAKKFWNELGLHQKREYFIICFFGYMGYQFDLETVIEAAIQIENLNKKIIFILCGDGDNYEYYLNLAKNCNNIIFPGWVDRSEIWVLLCMSSVGIAPYKALDNFILNLTNKPIEYLSAGLPIISSLRGILENLLNDNNCGITYQNKDVKDLIEKILYLYSNPSILKEMSKNAFRLYKQKFVAKEVYGEMIAHLEKIVKEYNKERN